MSLTFAKDTHRTPDQEKLGPKPKTYNYPEVRAAFPSLPSQSAATITNTVEAKYRKLRYKILWTGEQSLPSARYPQPYPANNQSWKASYEAAGKDDNGDRVPCVSVNLPGGRYILQLRGGREFSRQIADFDRIVKGEAVQGELSISQVRADSSRNGTSARDSGGQKYATRVMCKMVAWFPRHAAKQRAGTLFVTSDESAFLWAYNAKDNRLWTIHADHVKRWNAIHRAHLRRWSDDAKFERRSPMAGRRDKACEKNAHRINTACDQFAAQIVGYASRNGFASIAWVVPAAPNVDSFPWSRLLSRIDVLCDAHGMTFSKEARDAEVPVV